MKKLTTAKIWQFAAGQFGWALLSGIISNWLVYFYQPDETAISQGQTVFIPQGLVIFGVFTIIGGITAFGRIFDAFTDPMIASWSDRCTSKNGRRIPFLKGASLPLALSTVLVFWSPANEKQLDQCCVLICDDSGILSFDHGILYPIQCPDSGTGPYTAGTPEYIHHHFFHLYCRNRCGLSGTGDLGYADSFLRKSKCNQDHFHSHGSGSIRMHACAGILHPGKRLRRYRSLEGFGFSFPYSNLSEWRIPEICRI